MSLIQYEINGRFGNNLIQFLAAYILHKRLPGSTIQSPVFGELNTSNKKIIDENDWPVISSQTDEEVQSRFMGKTVLMRGYFQRGPILQKYQKYLLDAMSSNIPLTPTSARMCDIFEDIQVPQKTAVVHLRLDDFNHDTGTNVVHPSFYIQQMKLAVATGITDFLIVVDQLRLNSEHKYVQLLIREVSHVCPNIRVQSSTLLEDWNTIRCAPYVISSNSTFAFIACVYGILGNKSKKVIFPQTHLPRLSDIVELTTTLEEWTDVDAERFDYNSL